MAHWVIINSTVVLIADLVIRRTTMTTPIMDSTLGYRMVNTSYLVNILNQKQMNIMREACLN